MSVSDDRNTFGTYRHNCRVLADATDYLYFQTQSGQVRLLMIWKLIQKQILNYQGVANTGMLQTAIDAARAVLAQINRKASTAKLKAAYDAHWNLH